MADLLIGVGGGGQHVALAIARLVRLGLWSSPPEVVILDADDKAPLWKTLDTFEGKASVLQPHPLPALRIRPPFEKAWLSAEGEFADLFLKRNKSGRKEADPIERDLFELFFDVDLASTKIGQGMYARPCVGSAVFADAGVAALEGDLVSGLQDGMRVFVVGSFIGGTGAGIIHQLMPWLREKLKGKKGVKLYGSFLLNWLDVGTSGKDATRTTTDASMQHGLEYFFQRTQDYFDASVLVGTPPGGSPTKAHDKNNETVSVYPLLAAFGVRQLVNHSVDQKGVFFLEGEAASGTWLLEEEWGQRTERLDLRWKEIETIDALMKLMKAKKSDVRDFHAPGFTLADGPWREAIAASAEVLKVTPKALAEEVFDAFLAREEQIAVVTAWLRSVFGRAAPRANLKDETANLTQAAGLNSAPGAFEVLKAAYGAIPQEKIRKPPSSQADGVHTLSAAMEDALRAHLRR